MPQENTVSETKTDVELKDSAPSQIEQKPKYSEAEIAAYNLRKQAEKARELGLEPATVLNISSKKEDDEPLTMGKLKEMQAQQAKEEAFRMLDSIADETEREEVRQILSTRIVPSGNAAADLTLARSAVNALRNERIAQELARKPNAVKTAAGGSVSAPVEDRFEPTEEELLFMAPPYNLKKEQIIQLRTRK